MWNVSPVRLKAVCAGLLLVCVACAAGAAETITVGAAISLKEAMTRIARDYEADTGDKAELTFGSSGQLMGQIKAGAPIDVFISAANRQVDELSKEGLVDEATRRVVAANTLVLIVPADSGQADLGFDGLTGAGVKRIAVGEPGTVPAGQYAAQVFEFHGIVESVRDKIVYGTNVRQVLDYVERGEVSAGVVYRTDAIESGEKVKITATADPASHEPIVYPAAVVKASDKPGAAARFLDYLEGEKARAILAARGFGTPRAEPATRPSADNGSSHE